MENTGNVVETFRRYLAMLRMIPRRPRVIDGAEIERKLAAQGIYVTRRTIQRDLGKLSGIVPIVCRNGKPLGWSWTREAQLLELPGMDAAMALTFRLVETFLKDRLPAMVLESISPHLCKSREVLDATGDSGMARWPDKIAVVPRGMAFLPPAIAPQVLEPVYEALLQERRITISYRPRNSDGVREYRSLSPLGLVFVEGLIYLVGAFEQDGAPRQFLLHRMVSVEVLAERATVPEGFTLKKYVAAGEFAYPLTESTIRLKAIFDQNAAVYLRETPVAMDQRLTDRRDGRILLEADVPDSVQLRYWLKGFGAQVEVRGPKQLRQEFREMAQAMIRLYGAP
jgi:predicted DNA-binding transcriptional regulator YafY